MVIKGVYNLEFPKNIHELNIGGYKFTRIEEYEEAIRGMYHAYSEEFNISHQIGTTKITAKVEIPDNEDVSALAWVPTDKQKITKLNDVILLLQLFTQRDVCINHGDGIVPLSIDPRNWRGAGTGELRSFMEHDRWYKNKSTEELVRSIDGKMPYDYDEIDIGFEKTLNKILDLIHTERWKKDFANGHFLFLLKEVLGQVYSTTAFLMCWTICEHLFALHNLSWLSEDEIRKMSGESKICFLYQKYIPNYSGLKLSKELAKITRARNRLVHYGKVPDMSNLKEMGIFIVMTQEIIANILGLKKD